MVLFRNKGTKRLLFQALVWRHVKTFAGLAAIVRC
jgi:hypothetical protein